MCEVIEKREAKITEISYVRDSSVSLSPSKDYKICYWIHLPEFFIETRS